jgi:hypothetical protein
VIEMKHYCHVIDTRGELLSKVREVLVADMTIRHHRPDGWFRNLDLAEEASAVLIAADGTETTLDGEGTVLLVSDGPSIQVADAAFDLRAAYLPLPSVTPQRLLRFVVRALIRSARTSDEIKDATMRLLGDAGLTAIQLRIVLDSIGVMKLSPSEYELGPHGLEYHRREIRRKTGVALAEIPRQLIRLLGQRRG